MYGNHSKSNSCIYLPWKYMFIVWNVEKVAWGNLIAFIWGSQTNIVLFDITGSKMDWGWFWAATSDSCKSFSITQTISSGTTT